MRVKVRWSETGTYEAVITVPDDTLVPEALNSEDLDWFEYVDKQIPEWYRSELVEVNDRTLDNDPIVVEPKPEGDAYVHDLSQEAIDQARAALPDHLLAGLDDYISLHVPVGHFLTALLQNDLLGAYSRADATSTAALPALVQYLHWCLPSTAFGSPEKVKAWLAKRGE